MFKLIDRRRMFKLAGHPVYLQEELRDRRISPTASVAMASTLTTVIRALVTGLNVDGAVVRPGYVLAKHVLSKKRSLRPILNFTPRGKL
jgi:hypothetical protein